MLLDQLFGDQTPVETIIVRKGGKLSCKTRPVEGARHDDSLKPLFPISKERS